MRHVNIGIFENSEFGDDLDNGDFPLDQFLEE